MFQKMKIWGVELTSCNVCTHDYPRMMSELCCFLNVMDRNRSIKVEVDLKEYDWRDT